MTLDAFISESLKSIIKAVKETQEYARESGGRINPILPQAYVQSIQQSVYFGSEKLARPLTVIKFDIAVTTSSQQGTEVGGGIKVWSIGIGGKDVSADTNETVSRIKFDISVALPHELD